VGKIKSEWMGMKMRKIDLSGSVKAFLKYQIIFALLGLAILEIGCEVNRYYVVSPGNTVGTNIVVTIAPKKIIKTFIATNAFLPTRKDFLVQPPSKPSEGRPRIHSIGDSSPVLVFTTDGDLEIPIRGQDLTPDAWNIAVDVQPAASLKPGVDYYLDTTNPSANSSLIFLHFSNHAITNFVTCDRLTVNINISKKSLDYGLVQNAFDMADLSKSILFPKFSDDDKSNMLAGHITLNRIRHKFHSRTDRHKQIATGNRRI
jgi:hypothetical protein